MAERVQVVLEDESRMKNPEALVEVIEILERLRALGNHSIEFESETAYTRIVVRTEKKKSFWKRIFS